MTRSIYHILATGLLALVLWGGLASESIATPMSSFSPPADITVEMHELYPNGAKKAAWCSPGNDRWGCSAHCTNYPDVCTTPATAYPFSGNPVTVQIEGTATNDRYLRDVVPQEMGPAAYHPTAIQAQAIAARSFAYYHIRQGSSINNSTQFQAFIPRKYDTLTASQKTIVNVAVQDRY
ncbi:MAG: hypothetical protein CVU38_20625, partial [Chloroflexi bacterium HGW-Chloroflexi-1]